ncbi:MAG: hypothetical protein CMJ95_01110 [Planctomycetes bacterium]|nr:hypothetical protein [Planctomycetota bacterium]
MPRNAKPAPPLRECWICLTKTRGPRNVTVPWRVFVALAVGSFPEGLTSTDIKICHPCAKASLYHSQSKPLLLALDKVWAVFPLGLRPAAQHGLNDVRARLIDLRRRYRTSPLVLQELLRTLPLPPGVEIVPASPGGGVVYHVTTNRGAKAQTMITMTGTLVEVQRSGDAAPEIIVTDAVGQNVSLPFHAIARHASTAASISAALELSGQPAQDIAVVLEGVQNARRAEEEARAATQRAEGMAAGLAIEVRDTKRLLKSAEDRQQELEGTVAGLREVDAMRRQAVGENNALRKKDGSIVAFRDHASEAAAAAVESDRARTAAEAESRRLRNELSAKEDAIKAAEDAAANDRKASNDARERLAAQRQRLQKVAGERDAAKASLTVMQKAAAALKDKGGALEEEIASLREEKVEREKELQRVRTSHSRLSVRLPSASLRSDTRSSSSSSSSSSDRMGTDMSELQAVVAAAAAERGEEAVAAELADILESSLTETLGGRVAESVRGAARRYTDLASTTGKSWRELWDEFPKALTATLMAIAGSSGRDDQRFTTLFAMASMLMNLANPSCNHLVQRQVATLAGSNMGGKAAMASVLKAFSLSVSSFTAHSDRAAQAEAGEKWINLVIALVASLNCIIYVVFDNIDWDMGRADQAQHMLLSILCIGDPPVRGVTSKARHEITVNDVVEKTSMEEGASSAARAQRHEAARRLAATTELRTNALLTGDTAANLERAAELSRTEAKLRRRGRRKGQADSDGGGYEFVGDKKCMWDHFPGQQQQPLTGRAADELVEVGVVRGEVLENVAIFPEMNLAAFNNSDGKKGYVPLRCITGREEDQRGAARSGAGLTTPIAQQKVLRRAPMACADSDYLAFLRGVPGCEQPDDSQDESFGEALVDELHDEQSDVTLSESLDGHEPVASEALRLRQLDEQLRSGAADKQRANNGFAPLRPESSAVLSMEDERASDYAGVKRSIDKNMAKLTAVMEELKVELEVLFACDGQPWKLLVDELDRKRKVIVARLGPLRKKLAAAGSNESEHLRVRILALEVDLRKLDLEVKETLGWFHGNMAAIRGLAKTHKDTSLRGLFSHAGLAETVVDKALDCASGYFKFMIDMLEAAVAAWVIEEDCFIARVGLAPEEIDPLRASVPAWSCHRIVIEDTESVLNLDKASSMRGADANSLKNASIKECMLVFASGCCYNYLYLAPQDIVYGLVASQPIINARTSNPTLPRRRYDDLGVCDPSPSYPDETIEVDGVGLVKANVVPQPTTVVPDTMALNASPGAVGGLLAEVSAPDATSATPARRVTMDFDETVARMRAAYRLFVFPTIEMHVSAARSGKDVSEERVPSVPLLGKDMDMATEQNEMYTKRLRDNQTRLSREAAAVPLAVETGGSVQGGAKKKVHHKRISLFVEAKKEQARAVKKRASRMQAALGLLYGEDEAAARLLLCVAKVEDGRAYLRHASAKSDDRKYFLEKCPEAFAWTASGDVIGDDVGQNLMVPVGGGDEVNCSAVSLDLNQFARNIPPHTSVVNPTGESALLALLRQSRARAIGFQARYLIADVGGDPLKKMEENLRDKGGTKVTPPNSFRRGDLGKQARNYFQAFYQDRSPGGGRDQIYKVFHELLTAPSPQWSDPLRAVMIALCANGAVFGISGIGATLQQKKELHTFKLSSRTQSIVRRTESPGRENREDGEAVAVLIDKALRHGENAVMYGFDQDFVSIALVCMARALRKGQQLGRLFVRQKDQQGQELVDMQALYDSLESEGGGNHLSGRTELGSFGRVPAPGFRALSIVVASMAAGRDTSAGIAGVGHVKVLQRYEALAPWVGQLVRAATEEEQRDGREIVVDKEAMVRFYTLQYVERKASIFFARWKAMGVTEKALELDKLKYEGAEKTVAEAVMPNIVDLMPACVEGDSGRCVVTALVRLLTDQLTVWNNATVAAPKPFRYDGLVATVEASGEAVELAAPTLADLDAGRVIAVRAAFPTGSNGLPENPRTMAWYFGTDGLGKAIVRNLKLAKATEEKQRPRKVCDVCFHDEHGDGECSECGGECTAHCKKCPHVEHGTSVCSVCIQKPGSFAKCIHRCVQCKHNGAFSGHKKNGCVECGDSCGCNLLRTKKRKNAAAGGPATAGDGQGGQMDVDSGGNGEEEGRDGSDNEGDRDDGGVRDGLEEVMRSAEEAGIEQLGDAVAVIAGADDNDLGDIVEEECSRGGAGRYNMRNSRK